MGVNITTIVYLRVLIIQIGSTIILMVVEATQRPWKSSKGLACDDLGYKQNHRWGEKPMCCAEKNIGWSILDALHGIPKLNPDNRLLLWVRDCESLALPMKDCIS